MADLKPAWMPMMKTPPREERSCGQPATCLSKTPPNTVLEKPSRSARTTIVVDSERGCRIRDGEMNAPPGPKKPDWKTTVAADTRNAKRTTPT